MALRASRVLLIVVLLFIAIQLVPYGRSHTTPPVVQEPVWNSPDTRTMVVAACYDCHSNETKYPWYSSIAPSSWLVQHDVDGGRRHLNFSEWNREQRHAKDAAEEVRSGDMPQTSYTWMHAEARLSTSDREKLAAAFEQMFGKAPVRPAR